MRRLQVMDLRLPLAGLIMLFILGCASTRGGVGYKWGSPEPAHQPETKVAHTHGPPDHAPAHGYRAKYSYRYYPAKEVYYNTERRLYFYIEGGVWVSDALLPYQLRISLGEYEIVEMDTDTPYAYHAHKTKKKNKVPPGQTKKKKKLVKY